MPRPRPPEPPLGVKLKPRWIATLEQIEQTGPLRDRPTAPITQALERSYLLRSREAPLGLTEWTITTRGRLWLHIHREAAQ